MTVSVASSAPIERVSPSLLNRLLSCPLRHALAAKGETHVGSKPPEARLGSAAHAVLEAAVKTRALFGTEWLDFLHRSWQERIAIEEAKAAEAGDIEQWGPAESWPSFHARRARLQVAAIRLKQILGDITEDVDLLTEHTLRSDRPPLIGQPDLIVRGPSTGLVVDYKSGVATDHRTGELREDYRRQLHLYAYLENAETGKWPSAAILLPFKGSPVVVDVDPAESTRTAELAEATRQEYNNRVPGPQPAEPSASACRYCSSIPDCAAHWSVADRIASEGFVTISGLIIKTHVSLHGGVTLSLEVERGPETCIGPLTVERIDPVEHRAVGLAQPSAGIVATGLYQRRQHGDNQTAKSSWRISSRGRIWVSP